MHPTHAAAAGVVLSLGGVGVQVKHATERAKQLLAFCLQRDSGSGILLAKGLRGVDASSERGRHRAQASPRPEIHMGVSVSPSRHTLEREMLTTWSLDQLLAETPPPSVVIATEALERASRTQAPSDVGAFVRPSLEWLERATEIVYPKPSDRQSGEAELLWQAFSLAVEQTPLQVAFSGWRLRLGRQGVWVAMVDRLRELASEYGVVDVVPLGPTRATASPHPLDVGHRASAELFTLIADELKRMVGDQSALNEIRDVLRLSETELGDLLKVRRQAVAQWRRRGIPSERADEIDQHRQLCRYLTTAIKPERIPAVVRRSVPQLGGRTWLEALREEGPVATHERFKAVFSYQAF